MTTVRAEHGDGVDAAAEALRIGQIIVMPTDTVYGVAADAFNRQATGRIFAAKGRDWNVPLPVMVRSPKQLAGICRDVPEAAENLMAAYWPGPLTIVLEEAPGISWNLGNSEKTVAVRMPLDDVALEIIRAVGPLAVTSANRSGLPPATTIDQAREQLGDAVTVYVDGGERAVNVPSTIVDLTRGAPEVLRAGDIPSSDIAAVADGRLDPAEAAARLVR